MKVIYIDSYKKEEEHLSSSLKAYNIEVHSASSDYNSVLDEVRSIKPDIALIDIDTKKTDGFKLSEKLSAYDRNLKIIFLSERDSTKQYGAFRKSGAIGFISKSAKISQLAEAITTAAKNEVVWYSNDTEGLDLLAKTVSPKQKEVLQYLAEGCKISDIASEMNISEKTVRNYTQIINQIFDTRSYKEAIVKALECRLVRVLVQHSA